MPFDASGSSQTIAMLLVSSGSDSQFNGGEILSPSHVYFFGIAESFLNALEARFIFATLIVLAEVCSGCWAFNPEEVVSKIRKKKKLRLFIGVPIIIKFF